MHPWKVTVTIRDDKNALAYVQWYVQADLILYPFGDPGTAANDNVGRHVESMIGVLEPLISGQIINCVISYTFPLSSYANLGLKSAPEANSDVEEGLRFLYSSSQGSSKLTIPTIREELIVNGQLDYLASVPIGGAQETAYAGQFLDAFNDAQINTPIDNLQYIVDARNVASLTLGKNYQVFKPRAKYK